MAGARRVAVATAYKDEVTERLKIFLEENGFEVVATKGSGDFVECPAIGAGWFAGVQRTREGKRTESGFVAHFMRRAEDARHHRAAGEAMQSTGGFEPAAWIVEWRPVTGAERQGARVWVGIGQRVVQCSVSGMRDFQESRRVDDRVVSSALDQGHCSAASTRLAFTGFCQCMAMISWLTTRLVRPLRQRIVLGRAAFGWKSAWTWLSIMTHG